MSRPRIGGERGQNARSESRCSALVKAAQNGAYSLLLKVPVFEVRLGHFTIELSELTLPAGEFELVVTNVDAQMPHALFC